jgi:hypothetical protein
LCCWCDLMARLMLRLLCITARRRRRSATFSSYLSRFVRILPLVDHLRCVLILCR